MTLKNKSISITFISTKPGIYKWTNSDIHGLDHHDEENKVLEKAIKNFIATFKKNQIIIEKEEAKISEDELFIATFNKKDVK